MKCFVVIKPFYFLIYQRVKLISLVLKLVLSLCFKRFIFLKAPLLLPYR